MASVERPPIPFFFFPSSRRVKCAGKFRTPIRDASQRPMPHPRNGRTPCLLVYSFVTRADERNTRPKVVKTTVCSPQRSIATKSFRVACDRNYATLQQRRRALTQGATGGEGLSAPVINHCREILAKSRPRMPRRVGT